MRPQRNNRKYIYLAHDLLIVCLTLVVALYLRHGIPLIQEGKPSDIFLLLGVTLLCGLVVLPLLHTHTSIWRYTSSSELMNLMIAVALIIVCSNGLLFTISRLQMMPRSVPPIHWALAVVGMGASRLLARKFLGQSNGVSPNKTAKEHVIVVGVNHTAELYLRFIRRIVMHPVVIEGFVDSDPALTGRMFQRYKILGTVAELPALLEQLLVHGVQVRHIILTHLFEDLSNEERALLIELKKSNHIDLIHFAKHIVAPMQPKLVASQNDFYARAVQSGDAHYPKINGIYPRIKRSLDVVLALSLIVLLLPLIMITTLVVLYDVGFPILFWQLRPGRYGRPFKLYKFRTMKSGRRSHNEDRHSHKLLDRHRTTVIGRSLRRLRLDELPQLVHILVGTMSFVGPRPLLPDDQPEGGHERLSVRPGVTGWAQIHGGDALSAEEKLLLDVWYIRHLSFWLDVKILLATILVVFRPDTRKTDAIERIRKATPHS